MIEGTGRQRRTIDLSEHFANESDGPMAKAKPVTSRWSDGSVNVDELPPRERLAHEIVSAHGDLLPSVVRIMDADLDEERGLVALTAFRDSIDVAGDPNRDPRVAIANAAG